MCIGLELDINCVHGIQVTPSGELVYRFPALQRTTGDAGGSSVYRQSREDLSYAVQSGAYLQETEIQFTAAQQGQVGLAMGLHGCLAELYS